MRPDKNKGKSGGERHRPAPVVRASGVVKDADLAASLLLLEKDLGRLQSFLATYERSSHPSRIEAIRWLQPSLGRHLRVLEGYRRNAEPG